MPADIERYRTPGQLIRKLLEERGWTQSVLAVVLGVSNSVVNMTIAGKRELSADMAIALARVFDVPAEKFFDLQKRYELSRAKIEATPDPGLSRRAKLFGALPIAAMIKRRWIGAENIRDVEAVENGLARFFGADSPDKIPIFPYAAKKTDTSTPVTPAQLAWLYRVSQIAKEMVTRSPYSEQAGKNAVSELSGLLSTPEESRHVPRILDEAGVRYVIVEPLPNAKIDGVCFWLDDNSPVIGMSLRFDRIDNFWFVLRHELEHALRYHGRSASTAMVDPELEGVLAGVSPDLPKEERQANEAASDFCVPKKDFESFVARKHPFFAEKDVRAFAGLRQLHPGLVAGQIRHHLKRWDLFTNHLVKIRSCVTPSAIVDGWGNVAPVAN